MLLSSRAGLLATQNPVTLRGSLVPHAHSLPFLLLPASIRTGQNRRAGGEQWPPGEATGKDESQPQCVLVPAVNTGTEGAARWGLGSSRGDSDA